jgi:hypothetical protein
MGRWSNGKTPPSHKPFLREPEASTRKPWERTCSETGGDFGFKCAKGLQQFPFASLACSNEGEVVSVSLRSTSNAPLPLYSPRIYGVLKIPTGPL